MEREAGPISVNNKEEGEARRKKRKTCLSVSVGLRVGGSGFSKKFYNTGRMAIKKSYTTAVVSSGRRRIDTRK